MAGIVMLDKDAHRDLRVDAQPSDAYGDNIGMIGVVPREFGRLVAHYPIFLRRTAPGDAFECGAMLGFAANENLFLSGSHWDALYVPLNVQRQPFAVVTRPGDAAGTLAVAFDSDSPRLAGDGGDALFLGDGQPSAYLQRVTAALNEMVQGGRTGLDYAARLDALGLIEKVHIDVRFADGSQIKLDGLHSIARDKLMALPPEKLGELRDAGYLEWIYIQLASLVQLNGLIARKNGRLAEAAADRESMRRAATPARRRRDR